jgi:putative acetyltransferase
MAIRAERPADLGPIAAVTRAAFRDHPFSQQTEHRIVRALREAGALTLSLVATIDVTMVGHVAFSPVTVDGRDEGWYGPGPVSVWPERQRRSIGSALIRAGLAGLRAQGAQGCVVLGDPRYYRRFGFAPHPPLQLPGAPADHFKALAFAAALPAGTAAYRPAAAVSLVAAA